MNNTLLSLRILIVDDIPEHAQRLKRKISHLEHTVLILNEPEEAIKLIKSEENIFNPIDLAILDYIMPGMNGIELGETLKHIDPDLEIIILSSDSSRETAREILLSDLNPRCFVLKSEDIKIMESAIHYVMAAKENRLGGEFSSLRERQARYNGKKNKEY